ncbi:MAG: hypothetical protein K8R63_08480, partial [Bacteroidales bacterium]|nr:hypothetical protein [Bacteroidales bacterium]
MRTILSLLFYIIPVISFAQLLQLTSGNADEYYPKWSPDDTKIAFSRWTDQEKELCIYDFETNQIVPMDIDLEGDFHISWSPDGLKIAFDAEDNNGVLQIWTIDTSGNNLFQLTNFVAAHPAWSPDGSQIAFTSNLSGNLDIWTLPSIGGSLNPITTHTAEDWHACWSPDGSKIAFTSDRSGNYDVWIISSDGTNPEQFTFNEGWDDCPCWSYDDSKILYMSDKSGNWDIWTKTIDDEIFEQITFDEALDVSPDYSSDGSKMAFISYRNEDNPNVWIKTFSNTGIIDNNKTITLTNYPNPFIKSTTIEFEVKEHSKVSLKIYDIHGKEVKTLL